MSLMHNPSWRIALGVVLVLALAGLPAKSQGAPKSPKTAEASPIQAFDATSATPRKVEPTTSEAVQRDYAHAWQRLVSALGENRTELLNEDFTGSARQQWQQTINDQKQNGLSRRIADRGHRVQIRFYSPDGSAMEALDTAELQIDYLDGSRILYSEHVTVRYLVLLTPAENSWKVRVLQELAPG
jgi:hypothetical protein